MAVNKVYLTIEGARVATHCQINDQSINFTKFGLGDGENLTPKTATAMTREAVRIPVTMVQEVAAGHYRVRGEMSNDAIEENLQFRELCLYCDDPQNPDSEVMYCYGNAKGADFDYTEEIPAFDVSGAYSSRIFDIDVFTQTDASATFAIDPAGKADIQTVAALQTDVQELRAEMEGLANSEMMEELRQTVEGKADTTDVEELRAEIEGLADSEMMEELRQTVEGKADATAVQEMLGNISSLKLAGTNGFTPETDTFEAWAEKGNSIWFFESGGQLNGQAGDYGLLANFVNPENDVHQLWFSQPAGGIMHRSGNQTTGLGEWILLIDSDNIGQYVGGGSAVNAETYTFVIDSDEKLAEWANNDRSKGQDYTSVLIRKGEWFIGKEINLTDTVTKVVKGEAGSKLIFDYGQNSLYYTSIPTDNDCYIKGVNVVKTYRGKGFYNCKNLINCTCKVTEEGDCIAFSNCENIINCTGYGRGDNGYGFRDCKNLTNCKGIGVIEYEEGSGYGFYNCRAVYHCKAGGSCTSGVFNQCYASNSSIADYACADTPAGGFNDTTNPGDDDINEDDLYS
jgi:hypothetical protein